MKYDPLKHHRQSIRLRGYDYAAPGAYFVTIVAWRRELFFDDPTVRQLAEACWRDIPAHAPNVTLDEWVIMPNHVHGIIVIGEGGVDAKGNQGMINAPTMTPLDDPTMKSLDDSTMNASGNMDDHGRGVQLNAPTMTPLDAPAMKSLDDPAMNASGNMDHFDGRDMNNVFSLMSPRRHSLAVIVRTYKAAVTTACRKAPCDFGWQRGYYEHVARDAADLDRIRSYIETNPARWAADQLNPNNQH